ncbi:hypothetical protein SKAU_G00156740 [Synaphobranchus kaupii]|uniref:Uncharacterized protein n=1 Tax=Synaphobranchus kaupii TaxID=118154 RepID=A0A9Q1FHQ2_SYNKA|nr:hypothetical protein SKAU_G00156740 [Synaphobranchus kaupii]
MWFKPSQFLTGTLNLTKVDQTSRGSARLEPPSLAANSDLKVSPPQIRARGIRSPPSTALRIPCPLGHDALRSSASAKTRREAEERACKERVFSKVRAGQRSANRELLQTSLFVGRVGGKGRGCAPALYSSPPFQLELCDALRSRSLKAPFQSRLN